MKTFDKDPDEVLDYTINWANRLLPSETISDSTWTLDAGITKDSDSLSGSAATIWLSGGVAGTKYVLVNRITTSAGRKYEQPFRVNCVDSKNQ